MTEDQFWAMIEQAKNVPDDEKVDLIQSHLSQLPEADLSAFATYFSARMAESYQWPLWGAAYLMNGGCSDDGFDYFRGWLICQGQAVFRNALSNPDSLADYVNPDQGYYDLEEALSMAQRVYHERTGKELPYEYAPQSVAFHDGATGEDWDFDDEDECAKHLPQLTAMFL